MTKTIERDPGRHAERPMLVHYLPVVRQEGNDPKLMHLTLGSGEDVLPVFSSRGAAQNFLLFNAPGREWQARESYAGELISLLFRLHAEVEWVLLDPLPECLATEKTPANLMPWESFVDYLAG